MFFRKESSDLNRVSDSVDLISSGSVFLSRGAALLKALSLQEWLVRGTHCKWLSRDLKQRPATY